MNANDFARQAEEMMKAAKDARIPENMQAMAQESVENSRKVYIQLTNAAKDNARVAEDVVTTVQTGAKVFGEKVIANTVQNTDAVFDAALNIARAKTLPEAARLQAEFAKSQFTAATTQSQELMQLSAKMAQATLDQMGQAAAKSFANMKKTG